MDNKEEMEREDMREREYFLVENKIWKYFVILNGQKVVS